MVRALVVHMVRKPSFHVGRLLPQSKCAPTLLARGCLLFSILLDRGSNHGMSAWSCCSLQCSCVSHLVLRLVCPDTKVQLVGCFLRVHLVQGMPAVLALHRTLRAWQGTQARGFFTELWTQVGGTEPFMVSPLCRSANSALIKDYSRHFSTYWSKGCRKRTLLDVAAQNKCHSGGESFNNIVGVELYLALACHAGVSRCGVEGMVYNSSFELSTL